MFSGLAAFLSFCQVVQQTNFQRGKCQFGEASGSARFIIVSQKILQLRMQKTAIRLASRAAVLSRDSSALQPDFRIL